MFLVLSSVILAACFAVFIFFNLPIIPRKNVAITKKNVPYHRNPSLLRFFIKCVFVRNESFSLQVMMFQWLGAVNRLYSKERIFCMNIADSNVIQIFKPEYLLAILGSNTIIDKSWFYKTLPSWLGNSVLLSTGTKWRKRRKLLTPAFHFKILQNFLPVINAQSNVLIIKIKKKQKEAYLDIIPFLSLCSLEIITETAMGIQLNIQENEESDYVKAIQKVEKAVVDRVIRPWLWPDVIFYFTATGREYRKALKIVHNFTRKIIAVRRKELVKELAESKENIEDVEENVYFQTKKCRPLLDLLLHHSIKGDLTEEDIREEVNTFTFAGHDTTAIGMSWTIYNLGLYPTVQNRVHEELLNIFGDDRERFVTSKDLTEMKYLECVIKESLRLYPPVPFISRSSNENVKINDYSFPKSSVYTIHIQSIHRDPELFKNPDIFDPERFFPENSLDRHPMAFIPFSAGPRNCIGQKFAMMEEKVIISNILRHFRVESLDKPDKIIQSDEIVLRPLGGLRIRFVER